MNSMSVPDATFAGSTAKMSFNIEHTRAINYTIKVIRTIQDRVPIQIEDTPITGTLAAGVDDIVGSTGWVAGTTLQVTVTLTDTTLRNPTWERIYDITGPTPPDKPFVP
jgi:hypothetical protein